MASSGTSKYGLFIPKKPTKGPALKPAAANVFGDDSDEESGTSAVNQTVNRESARAKIRKQTQLEIDKALQEDPSVYEYDSIYDNIQAQKVSTDVKEAHKVDKKPKYIAGLMKMAEVRKREEERRVERKVQKEREEEGDLYADKEAFVTSAYKKKMLEQQAEAERERREAAMEEMLDVTKQKDLSGFYRYLYRETTGTGLTESPDAVQIKEESRVKVKEEPHSDADSDDAPSAREKKPHTAQDTRHASHRSRRDSDNDNDEKAAPKHRPSTEKPKANGSSRQRSRSREKERQRHRHRRSSGSSSPARGKSDKHRHRSRSRDRKRDRSSSRDRTRRPREEPGRRDEEGSSRKEEKKRGRSSREESSPPADTKETSAKISPPPADRSPSPEMLPARPPDEDLDRDDSASESASSSDEASAGKREGQGQVEENSASKGRKREGVSGNNKDTDEKKDEPKVKYARKTTDKEMLDARQRFLARKLARERARPVVEPE